MTLRSLGVAAGDDDPSLTLAVYRRLEDVPADTFPVLADTYAQLLREPPWEYATDRIGVARRLRDHMSTQPARLSVLWGDGGRSIAGFSCGSVVPVAGLAARLIGNATLQASYEPHLEEVVADLGVDRVVFAPDLAVTHAARGGRRSLSAFARLTSPLFALTAEEGTGMVCWTVYDGPAYRIITRAYGFEIVDAPPRLRLLWCPPTQSAAVHRALSELETARPAVPSA